MVDKSKLAMLRCPICHDDLSQQADYLVCPKCGAKFPIIDDIIIFLTKEDVSTLLDQPWGSQLQKDFLDWIPDFFFATNEHDIETLRSVKNQVYEKSKDKEWVYTNEFPDTESLGLPQGQRDAIDNGRDKLIAISRAPSATKILDWPTGSGSSLKRLIHQVPADALVASLEINFRQVVATKMYFDHHGLSDRMIFVVADARNMPFEDNIFQCVTASGGTVEIANPDVGMRETFRVLESGGWYGLSGDQYEANSESIKIAEKLHLQGLLTKEELTSKMEDIGFGNLEYQVLYEGRDNDFDVPDEDRCPLPARGDWFQYIIAAGQR